MTSSPQPQLTTKGSSQLCTSAAHTKTPSLWGHEPFVTRARIDVAAEIVQVQRNMSRTCAPSTIESIPASRARRQISFTGKINAVGLVMWLMKIILVRSFTPCQKCSTKFSCVVAGSFISLMHILSPQLFCSANATCDPSRRIRDRW